MKKSRPTFQNLAKNMMREMIFSKIKSDLHCIKRDNVSPSMVWGLDERMLRGHAKVSMQNAAFNAQRMVYDRVALSN